jgi:3-dehydroquinate synthase
MNTLTVDLGARSYPIYIGQNLLSNPQLITPHVVAQQVMIVTNETVAPLYLDKVRAAYAQFNTHVVLLPDGEVYKTLESINRIFEQLLTQRYNRQATLVALGGGVIGDMTGFAAACYQRGIQFIQTPTTLLSQVDSSVGGKTGVNHPLGKNMIGAFHQPRCVVIDTDTLATLDDRQLSAGLAEVIKYGLINDPEFFSWLEAHADALLARDSNALAYAIARSCQDKAAIVAQDEHETSGTRALLNLGHTFGHAIETGSNYVGYLHGEAVAIGIHLAAQLSQHLGWLTLQEVERIKNLLQKVHLPVHIPAHISAEQMLALMQVDKKVQHGKVRLILLQGIGKSLLTEDYSAALLHKTLTEGYADLMER